MPSGWFFYLRATLELLYFGAGIVIAIFAGLGLRQITLTKKIANTTAKRESLKFAAERCQYYADHVVPAGDAYTKAIEGKQLTYIKTLHRFTISNGEIRFTAPIDLKRIAAEYAKVGFETVNYLNKLEAFAIPFAANVADDVLGFQETAPAFLRAVEGVIGIIALMRTAGPRYESIIGVYDLWHCRLEAQNMQKKLKEMQAEHERMQQKGKPKSTESL